MMITVMMTLTSQLNMSKFPAPGHSSRIASETTPILPQLPQASLHFEGRINTGDGASKDKKQPLSAMYSERGMRSAEFGVRRMFNYYVERKLKGVIDDIHKTIMPIKETDPAFVPTMIQVGRKFANAFPIEVEMNEETGRLQEIVNSDDACLFIINHDYQSQDPVLLSIFCMRLYQEYVRAGKAEGCPLPKIVMNEDILLSQGTKQRQIYEKMGAVGIDASLTNSQKSNMRNAMALLKIAQGLNKNKNHVFLFPEGRMSVYRKKDLREKFQDGVGEMVRIAIKKKGKVKVVPLGFAFDKNKKEKQPLGSIYIGEPVYFNAQDEHITTSIGNLSPELAPPAYQRFFWDKDVPLPPAKAPRRTLMQRVWSPFGGKKATPEAAVEAQQPRAAIPFQEVDGRQAKVITDQGQPVSVNDSLPFLLDILKENLAICRQQALNTLPKNTLGDKVVIC